MPSSIGSYDTRSGSTRGARTRDSARVPRTTCSSNDPRHRRASRPAARCTFGSTMRIIGPRSCAFATQHRPDSSGGTARPEVGRAKAPARHLFTSSLRDAQSTSGAATPAHEPATAPWSAAEHRSVEGRASARHARFSERAPTTPMRGSLTRGRGGLNCLFLPWPGVSAILMAVDRPPRAIGHGLTAWCGRRSLLRLSRLRQEPVSAGRNRPDIPPPN